MIVGGELYLIAQPRTIAHAHGELNEQREVSPVALMHEFPRVREAIFY